MSIMITPQTAAENFTAQANQDDSAPVNVYFHGPIVSSTGKSLQRPPMNLNLPTTRLS
ncbi:MAG: hypothetical protein PVI90_14820 [Desulfobacteraceae bacterium]